MPDVPVLFYDILLPPAKWRHNSEHKSQAAISLSKQ